ncbi:MAG: hypothetical protein KDI02_12575 [Anaerolineae bacterium]|nr:hypothetical protein [Anaerolineae bacterium]
MFDKSDRNRRTRTRNKKRIQPKPRLLQRLRRRDIILLTGLSTFACFVVVIVALLILRYQPVNSATSSAVVKMVPTVLPVHTVTFTQITGLSQFQPAWAAGQAWAADAQLIAASASWPGVLSVGQVGEPVQWSYRFYSPSLQRLLITKVEPDNQVTTVEHVGKITLPPPILDTDSWLIDSPAALAIWLDYGGAELLRRNPGLELLVQLRTIKNYPGPVWMVIGLDKRTQDIFVVVIDAAEGTVVSTDSSLEL